MSVRLNSAIIFSEEMRVNLEKTKKLYYFSVWFVITGGLISLLYYSFLMPLHVDESGFWFQYANMSYQHRFILPPNTPAHTLTIYLAKISSVGSGISPLGLDSLSRYVTTDCSSSITRTSGILPLSSTCTHQ